MEMLYILKGFFLCVMHSTKKTHLKMYNARYVYVLPLNGNAIHFIMQFFFARSRQNILKHWRAQKNADMYKMCVSF